MSCWAHALQWASDELRGNREVVLRAISGPGREYALQWASDDLKVS